MRQHLGAPMLTHSSPAVVGPLGGAVLLFHGSGLPYSDALRGRVDFRVGNALCPFLAPRSDPQGSFLACGPIPPFADPVTGSVTVHSRLYDSGGAELASSTCPRCELTYSPTLRADATLALTHLRGAAGDVITVMGTGAPWPLLEDSHGHHEQVTAMVGGHDALPRYPGSRAVTRPDEDYPWRLELVLPFTTAGKHVLRVTLDRMWHDEHQVRSHRQPAGCRPTCPERCRSLLPPWAGPRHRCSGWQSARRGDRSACHSQPRTATKCPHRGAVAAARVRLQPHGTRQRSLAGRHPMCCCSSHSN